MLKHLEQSPTTFGRQSSERRNRIDRPYPGARARRRPSFCAGCRIASQGHSQSHGDMRPTPAEGGFGPKGGPPSHSSYNKWVVSFVSLCWLPHGMSVFGRWNLCFGCCCMCIKGCEGRSSRASRFLDGRLHDRLAGFASERSWPKGLVRSNELRPQCLFFLRAVQPETELAGHLMDCPPRGQIRNVGGGLVSKEGGHHMCK